MSEEPLHPALADNSEFEGLETSESSDKGDMRGGDNPGDLAAIKKFLSIESRIDYKDEGDLRQIMEFAGKEGVVSDADLAIWLKQISLKLGTPSIGETRVRQMLHYLDLDHRIGELVKEQSAYTR